MMDLALEIPDAIHLEIGEPDFRAPPHVVDAAVRALRAGDSGYPPTAGLPELREALCEKLAAVNGIEASPDTVVVTNGGCQGMFNALAVLLDEGDAVALPDPGWPIYHSMVGLLGGRVARYSLAPERSHLPDPEEIDRLGAEGCRAVVLNSPSNPLGTVLPRPLVERIVATARRHGMWIVSDECYDELAFDGDVVSPAAVDPEAGVISVFSFSKTHAMTGWRVGYVVAPPWLAELTARAQEPLVMGVSAAGQHGAIAALADTAHVGQMRAAYRARRDRIIEELRDRGRSALVPQGGFYLWLDLRDLPIDDGAFALSLLEQQHVATAAGSSFGQLGHGFLRISLAAAEDALVEAASRIAAHIDAVREAPDTPEPSERG